MTQLALALSLQNVFKQYGDHVALGGVSVDVPQGSIFGLLGPNGAGKTTMIRMVASSQACGKPSDFI